MKAPIKFDTEQHAPAIVAISAIPEVENSRIAGIAEDSLSKVRSWLHFIGENSPTIIDDVLTYSRTHPEGLAYYLKLADEVPYDDRHYCRDCQQLRNGFCTAQRFRSVDNIPRRCTDFLE